MPAPRETWPESGRRVERITWLADAIFAFSITLLAIDLRVPDIAANLVATELPLALINLIPRFIGFLLTFWIVSSYWIAYHRLMSYVIRYDRGFISTTLLFLMFIVLLPFPADLFSRYRSQLLSLVIAAAFFAATGFALTLLWRHATHNHRLVDKTLDPQLIHHFTLQYLVSPAVFLGSIPLFYLTLTYAPAGASFVIFVWVLIVPLHAFIDRRYRRGQGELQQKADSLA